MIVDGKALSLEIQSALKNDVQNFGRRPRLDVIFAGDDSASAAFVKRKQAFGEGAGFEVVVHRPTPDAVKTADDFLRFCGPVFSDGASDAVIVQLPVLNFSKEETNKILNRIPVEKDADVLSGAAFERFAAGDSALRPPVVAAISMILKKYGIGLHGKNIAVVGVRGELVGKPVSAWLSVQKIPFRAIGRQTSAEERADILKNADIVISGVGSAGMLTPDLVKDGVIALDAGTSGTAGALRGDFDSAVASRALLFTPVPGGIGPLTVAALFRNVLALAQKKKPAL